ncbi:hypothetical protein [Oceanirhabdus sp. W0125-5]|uniref:hypothetical protein n=1 Tax=Oceanirhabdus sp. W0125-5 TaxID=2999116 RepID=UPI0022F2F712|nr:hypothetical protein [Oceanirhabdus sp. W0125-5]WBW98397.1 hypothetical protein OW730_06415 [Oceanirhabdus sp. W0125-5]
MEDEVLKEWFSEPKYIRSIGAVFDENFKSFYKEEIIPIVNYDAIIFSCKEEQEKNIIKIIHLLYLKVENCIMGRVLCCENGCNALFLRRGEI